MLGDGDEHVIVPAMTFSATAEAVIRAGGTPLVCDIDEEYLTPSLDDIKEAYLEAIYQGIRVTGVVLVHLYGWPAFDTLRIRDFCHEYGLFLLEDCAQAFGANLDTKMVGTFGDAAAYSFYPTKSLGGIGDAGAVMFPEKGLAEWARAKRNHGRTEIGQMFPGYNSRIDEPNAALLRYRLSTYEEDNVAKRLKTYFEYCAHGLKAISVKTTAHGVPYVFPILVGNREAVRFKLAEIGVQTGTHYDPPLSKLPYCQSFCPNAEWAAGRIVTLPCHHRMPEGAVAAIADAIREVNAP